MADKRHPVDIERALDDAAEMARRGELPKGASFKPTWIAAALGVSTLIGSIAYALHEENKIYGGREYSQVIADCAAEKSISVYDEEAFKCADKIASEASKKKFDILLPGVSIALSFLAASIGFSLVAGSRNRKAGREFRGKIAERADGYAAMRERDGNDHRLN